jgi:hypothetical protein
LELCRLNARLVIKQFQNNIIENDQFVKKIMVGDLDFFLEIDYIQTFQIEGVDTDYGGALMKKFKQAAEIRKDDKKTIIAIFNWFRMMIYHAINDQGRDAKVVLREIVQGN